MNKDQQEQKKFLEEQLRWCKEQDRILEEIKGKLQEMKRIADYASEHELTHMEADAFNSQLNKLKNEVYFLEKQLNYVVH